MEEADNILRILKETRDALKRDDASYIKELSNQTVHTASIRQDIDNVTVAVIVYALSKILERKNFRSYRQWPIFYKKVKLCLDRAIAALEKNQIDYFRDQITCLRKSISELSGNLRKHIQEVFRKAEINKASRIYEHGISMQQTAKLLGITLWELADYSGQTGISDINLAVTMAPKQRIKQAMDIFEK